MNSDGAGGMQSEWTALGTLWADVRVSSGNSSGSLGIERSAVRQKILVRAAPVGSTMRPRPDQRFREGDRIFSIRAVAEDEPMGRYLTCYAAEEVVA